jgi:threonine dehydratase
MTETPDVTLEDVERSRRLVGPYVHRTPLWHSETLSAMTGTDLWLKAENLQKTGSFKVRGAITAALGLSEEERRAGFIAVSAGNHAAAVAYAARMAGTRATLVMPEEATESKIAAVRAYGGRVELVDHLRLMESMEEIRDREGQVFIHPFNHPSMVAGAGGVGLEILEDLPDAELIVVPVGGGGLISGIATAAKAVRLDVRIIGVEPEGSTAVSQSLAAGKPVRLDHFASIADGLNAPWGGALTLSIIQRLVDEVVTVPDAEIASAMGLIIERTKLLVEPAGAAAVAALLSGVVPGGGNTRTVAILSGGNVDLSRIAHLIKST